MKHPIGQTRNGAQVYVNLIGSQAAKHIAQQPQLLTLAKEMLEQISVRGAEANVERDMQRLVGYNFIVTTTDADTILYGRFLKDEVYTRFVKNGKPLSTNYLTVTLRQSPDGGKDYELTDIWIGRLHPPRPGSDNETAESKPYWANHAFVLDSQPLQLRTVTKTCPY
ncbi:MAG TPA: hypothetical protein VLF62_01945 [Candidatus Saccharimonadales bacterium]|nr:hypothetical protein [Candidatus Saccharimonadales bacterium]